MGRLGKLWDSHPNLVSWFVLALGMVIIVVLAARQVGFNASQWAAVITATIGLAGLCVWIISWDREPELDELAGAASTDLQEPTEGQQEPAGAQE